MAPNTQDVSRMEEVKENCLVVDMENGNGKEVTNQNFVWNLGELGDTGCGNSGFTFMDGSCQTEATKVLKRNENISILSKFNGFRKAAYHILRVRKLATQIRPNGIINHPALMPNVSDSAGKQKGEKGSNQQNLCHTHETSNMSTCCGQNSAESHDPPRLVSISGVEAVESLKKYMEARVSETSLEADQPKLKFIPMYIRFLHKLGLIPVLEITENNAHKCFKVAQMVRFACKFPMLIHPNLCFFNHTHQLHLAFYSFLSF